MMRTTLTLEDDVVALLREAERHSGQSFKAVVNEAIRRGLAGSPRTGVAEAMPTYALGFNAGVDTTRALALAAELEDEALLARRALDR
jgi:hypothetical protein